MARLVSITKEKVLSAAVGVVRKGGLSALTSRNLCTELGCGVNAVFSAYGSMEGVQEAVRAEASRHFQKRLRDGLSLNPPFKGFGMALLWFAMDEPQLFKLAMAGKTPTDSFESYIDTHIEASRKSAWRPLANPSACRGKRPKCSTTSCCWWDWGWPNPA